MRGETERQATMMLGVTPDGFVPKDHPLRRIQALGRLGVGAHVVPVCEAVDCLEGNVSTTDSTDFGQ